MSNMVNTNVEILGKPYSILCPPSEIEALQKAATYLNQQITNIKDSGKVIGIEKIMIIAALNITHALLALQEEKNKSSQTMQVRIEELFKKVEQALKSQLELVYSE